MTPLEEILTHARPLASAGGEAGIVVSSRVRLARNFRGRKFPNWAGEGEALEVWNEVVPVLRAIPELGENVAASMEELEELDKLVLSERNLISREHVERGPGSGLVVALDGSISIMVNEEDHLRLQGLCPGLGIEETWERIDAIDSEIEKHLTYAYDLKLGYLTACPTNVGTGMRPSVMLHLPGLALLQEINPVIKGLGKIGLAVRGLGGEGSEAMGNLFQVSSQITLGQSEREMVDQLNKIVREVVKHEQNARKRLMQKKPEVVQDHVGRAQGILGNAHVLSSKEALDLLSGLRLGVDLDLIRGINKEVIDDLVLRTRPAHLQREMRKELAPRARDIERARLVRSTLAEATHHQEDNLSR